MKELKIFISESHNPYLNIATEEWIFNSLEPDTQVLYLWQNQNTVVIGRNQNPWTECNLQKMKEEQIFLARRNSGGGAVFHDLGNTNFTFLSPKDSYLRENNIQIILQALQRFGVKAYASGRNDLLVDANDGPRKFSGSAYREKRDRAFHHGTLLMNADLERLGHFLTPSPKKMKAKGKESVRSRVMNLAELNPEITHETMVQAIVEEFKKFYQASAQVEKLTLHSLESNLELKAEYEHLSSTQWLLGQTLEFTHQLDEYLSLGFFDFQLRVDEGRIVEAQVFSDSLYPGLIEDIKMSLVGIAYNGDAIYSALRPLQQRHASLQDGIAELANWLKKAIES